MPIYNTYFGKKKKKLSDSELLFSKKIFLLDFGTAWWSHRYNARTKSERAVVRPPNIPKIFFSMPFILFILDILRSICFFILLLFFLHLKNYWVIQNEIYVVYLKDSTASNIFWNIFLTATTNLVMLNLLSLDRNHNDDNE